MAALLATLSHQAAAANLVVEPGQSIQAAVRKATSGDTIMVKPGVYSETVFVDKDGVSLFGVIEAGRRATLDGLDGKFHDGIIVTGHGVTVEGFHVRNYKSNGITTQGANNFVIRNNIVEHAHLYGLFPQFGKNGLVAQNIVWGSLDAAIYVGMCENVDVIANEAYDSVLGIEAENSHYVLIESNYAHDNAVGIFPNLLPGLHTKTSSNTIVRNNVIARNNTVNYAPEGSFTSWVETGRGILINASDTVTVEGNVIRDNDTCGICVVDHHTLGGFPVDEKVDPRPDGLRIYRNIYVNNGGRPSGDFVVAATLERGADIINLTRGKDNCHAPADGPTVLGAESWSTCASDLTTAAVQSYQLAEPIASKPLTMGEQVRLTYLAVCSGCHAYRTRLIGPPVVAIQALYQNDARRMADWIAAPTRIRDDFPEMPPQNYIDPEIRLELARYILEEVRD
jgi:parallel beta-helix repeat protein